MLGNSSTCASTKSTSNGNNSNSGNTNSAGVNSSAVTTTNSASATSKAALPTNSIKIKKCESFDTSTESPCNDDVGRPTLLDEQTVVNNNNGVSNSEIINNNITIDGTNSVVLSSSVSSITSIGASIAIIPRQNSNSNSDNNTGSSVFIAATSSVSTTESSSNLCNKVDQPNKISKGSKLDNSNNEKQQDTSVEGKIKKELSGSLHIKDEEDSADLLEKLVHVKKEENVSPVMSPVGFGSIGNSNISITMDNVRPETPVKLNEHTAIKMPKTIKSEEVNGSSGLLININSNTSLSESNNMFGTTNITNAQQHHPLSNNFNNIDVPGPISSRCNTPLENGSSNNNNCVDYMQQQNHIFVFSTQLANRGAECVLNGQFPTIIAYHCTQPATRSFLEDFFFKNPMKMTKLQRQNTLNICNLSMMGTSNSGNQWLSNYNTLMSKMPTKSNNIGVGNAAIQKLQCSTSISSVSSQIENTGNKLHQSVSLSGIAKINNIRSFGDSSSNRLSSENELMCWEQSTRNDLDTSTINDPSSHSLKILEDPLTTEINPNKTLGVNITTVGNEVSNTNVDSNVPSLQGVKVPDENLTPQQLQHREEQLAKLKKMNQFLFPENDSSDFRQENNSSITKKIVPGEAIPGHLGLMINLSSVSDPVTSNSLRKISGKMINKSVVTTSEPIVLGPVSDEAAASSLVTSELLGSHGDSVTGPLELSCNNAPSSSKTSTINQQASTPCIGSVTTGTAVNIGVSDINVMASSGGNNNTTGSTNTLLPNSPELSNAGCGSYSQNCGSSGNTGNNIESNTLNKIGPNVTSGLNQSTDVNSAGNNGISLPEWSKLHQQTLDERLSCRKDLTDSYPRPLLLSTLNSRFGQGPPPPYHQHQQNSINNSTQRSASVPIATQSSNPGSPNNPTSNLSLPSPRTTGSVVLSMPISSPNMDLHLVSTSNNISITTTSNNVCKSNVLSTQQISVESPSVNLNSNNVANNRNRGLSQLNSNPSPPLSHMSPKDMETFNNGDLKNPRPSPQRSKTPLISNNSVDQCSISNLDSLNSANTSNNLFPTVVSPGINFSTHMQNISASGSNIGVNYKSSGTINLLERQNSALPNQFCRRIDNLPLNPNSGRPGQNTPSHHIFDPITSLAQMSQQLTSCVSLSSNIGLNSNVNGSVISNGQNSTAMGSGSHHHNNGAGLVSLLSGSSDINMTGNINPNSMDSMLSSLDVMDHCNPIGGSSNIMSIPLHMSSGSVTSPNHFLSNNTHIQNMLIPNLNQRLLNPKMCGTPGGSLGPSSGGFNPGIVSPNVSMNVRDPNNAGPGNFHGVMQSNHRMMTSSRMTMNYNNFNLSANIQVKASTPNTIQYMPMRPQNQNNMRIPSSIEFLQYTNPQIVGGDSDTMMDNHHLTQLNSNDSKSNIATSNNLNCQNIGSTMNFFQQQCSALDPIISLDQGQNVLSGNGGIGISGTGGGMLSELSLNNISMMRPNLRSMRQINSSAQPIISTSNILLNNGGPRMQNPQNVNNMIVDNGPGQFSSSGGTSDAMDCNDSPTASNMFGTSSQNSTIQIYSQTQQKALKAITSVNMCGNINLNGQTSTSNANNKQLSNVIIGNKSHTSASGTGGSGPLNTHSSSANSNNILSTTSSMGNNGPSIQGSCSGSGGNSSSNGNVVNYKSFVGPASNDLKYAQQYHSFQQQLYATSTRSQGNQGITGIGGNTSATSASSTNNSNAVFYNNK